MIVYINGNFVPEEKAVVSLFDRGFLYGDGLFETVRVCKGRPFQWPEHVERLRSGATRLGIHIPEAEIFAGIIRELVRCNQAEECLARIAISRGPGTRGYSPRDARTPTVAVSLHSLPPSGDDLQCWRVVTASLRSADPLAGWKTCNKLLQVLAKMEADRAGAEDALLLTPAGEVRETTASNLFWVAGGKICTPPIEDFVLNGITRKAVFSLAADLGIEAVERRGTVDDLLASEGVFLTQTTFGIIEVQQLDDAVLRRSAVTARLHSAYLNLLHSS